MRQEIIASVRQNYSIFFVARYWYVTVLVLFFVFCFVLFFSFMFFLATVVNLIALKEPSKALITRTRPFQKKIETISYPFAYQKSVLIS